MLVSHRPSKALNTVSSLIWFIYVDDNVLNVPMFKLCVLSMLCLWPSITFGLKIGEALSWLRIVNMR